jgi:hypothetical protein
MAKKLTVSDLSKVFGLVSTPYGRKINKKGLTTVKRTG